MARIDPAGAFFFSVPEKGFFLSFSDAKVGFPPVVAVPRPCNILTGSPVFLQEYRAGSSAPETNPVFAF